ncbi:MAG: gliding motility-associated C-terminal domain-containing protein [Bacteroidales bacterium]|jgi:gliding motility-associated-like protein
MTVKLSCYIKFFILSLLILFCLDSDLFSQRSISGVINQYAYVSTVGTDNVIVPDPTQFSYFSAGDTVLLMQMKGVECIVANDYSYGQEQTMEGNTGIYEFLIVLSVESGTQKVTFRNNIMNTYDVAADVQLIRVPSFNAATVNADLTCAVWDSTAKTGGVLALFVGTKLTLSANITTKAKGFRGGDPSIGSGNCINGDTTLNYYSYPYSYQNSGLKGESMSSLGYLIDVPIFPQYSKGYGPNFTGGGGGSGKFSGGGGGSLAGAGGNGGLESNLCGTNQENGGLGGRAIGASLNPAILFPGGGGGGSTYFTGATPTAGGRGGGIIIIICQTIDGQGNSIVADGETPGTASGNAGSGGGGGGGSIAISLQNFSSNTIAISANGGAGGNNAGKFGEGGGGGGGRITISNIIIPGNVTRTVNGGNRGTNTDVAGPTATSGSAGDKPASYAPVLNGFLFNYIISSVTLNEVDSVCSNVVPPPISGTTPTGGSGNYSYAWQKKYSLAGAPSLIAGANAITYTPAATEANTFWVRRIVTDNVSSLTDTSKWVEMIVQPAITGNLVGKDTTICYGQNPLPLTPLNSGPSNGNGYYVYQWLSNTDNTTWTNNASGTSTLAGYDPAALIATTYYKRQVTSGRCVDKSSTVTITVLPSITGNVMARPDSVICQGSLFNVLNASSASGGSGSYLYQWQDSTSSTAWQTAAGTTTNQTYSPDTSKFAVTQDRYYRRVVYSGSDSVCQNTSQPIRLTRYPQIENNAVAADQTICSGSTPSSLTGTTPTQGNLSYSYQWQDSTSSLSWQSISVSATNKNYSPLGLTDSTWFRRIVNSSKCTSVSNEVAIMVHEPIANNTASLLSGSGTDTTVCSGAVPNMIKGSVPAGGTNIVGDYAYQWQYSTDGSSYNPISVSATLQNYQAGALTVTTWFRRTVTSGMCSSFSNSIKVIVLPPITNNVITVAKSAVCFNTVPAVISGTALTGGAGGTPTWIWQQSTNGTSWTTISGGNAQNYSPTALILKTWYRRIIQSGGCCIDTSNMVTIDINPLPTGTITSVTDTTICSGSQVQLQVTLTGSPAWTLVYNENSSQLTMNGITASPVTITRIPTVSSDLTSFNYTLTSLTDNNGCAATSLSGARNANVYKTPAADAGSDDEVCGPEYTMKAVPSAGTGTWTFPSQVLSGIVSDPNAVIKIDSSFTAASVSYKFIWQEINWTCTSKDSVTITFDHRIDTVNAGKGGSVISFDNVIRVNAYPLPGYETGKWTVMEGSGNFDDNTSDTTYVRQVTIGTDIYKWTATNRKCNLSDTVLFEVSSPVIPEGISPNGDGINDTFRISGLDMDNQFVDLTIINGAGTVIFSATNRNGNDNWKNWDGRDSKGTMVPEGTYYYLLEVTTKKNEYMSQHVAKKSGFVILKRH